MQPDRNCAANPVFASRETAITGDTDAPLPAVAGGSAIRETPASDLSWRILG